MDLIQCTPEEWIENEANLMKNLENSSWNSFPLLNQVNSTTLKDGQIVRFIGMVQDMHNPEYYVERYVSINKVTNERTIKCGRYKDFITPKDQEIVNFSDRETVQKELQTFYVISVPAENQWVKKINAQQNFVNTVNENVGNCSLKRNLEEDGSQMETQDITEPSGSSNSPKKHCGTTTNCKGIPKTHLSTEYLLNFPIPDEHGRSCQVKIYQNTDEIKLNNIYEFIGFLSTDPNLSHENNQTDDSEKTIELQVHNPPPSLIPRMHCLTFKKLKHINPLVQSEDIDTQKLQYIRKELIILLTQLLLGDEVAAEYLLCHLISEVYVRADLMALGKFSLNLSNIPSTDISNYVEKIYNFIQLIVPKSHYLPLTIENMNTLTFIPKKDYDGDRLNSGLLQLSANTVVVLDETKLQPGKLDPAGVKAVQAIANTIRTQRISYDFNYYPVEFECDVQFLVCSEGKSMLPSDCHVVLRPDELHMNTYDEIVEAAKQFLRPELLSEIRRYLTLCRYVPYNFDENVHMMIQNKFLEMRQDGASADDLHNLLVLNRLLCLSYGKISLDEESWNIACTLEEKRKQRITK